MSLTWVLLAYGLAFVLALTLLYALRSLPWYWHAISVLIALFVGLMPPLEGWTGQRYDLLAGALFVFFLIWGVGSPLLKLHFPHLPRS
ncbi:MAG: hypothetical protein JNL98_34835 [Bryobacterales bacterium]|nr:hypothetical protein [Bryobacterales bacterium]